MIEQLARELAAKVKQLEDENAALRAEVERLTVLREAAKDAAADLMADLAETLADF